MSLLTVDTLSKAFGGNLPVDRAVEFNQGDPVPAKYRGYRP